MHSVDWKSQLLTPLAGRLAGSPSGLLGGCDEWPPRDSLRGNRPEEISFGPAGAVAEAFQGVAHSFRSHHPGPICHVSRARSRRLSQGHRRATPPGRCQCHPHTVISGRLGATWGAWLKPSSLREHAFNARLGFSTCIKCTFSSSTRDAEPSSRTPISPRAQLCRSRRPSPRPRVLEIWDDFG